MSSVMRDHSIILSQMCRNDYCGSCSLGFWYKQAQNKGEEIRILIFVILFKASLVTLYSVLRKNATTKIQKLKYNLPVTW